MSRSRNWLFTENNPEGLLDPEDWPGLKFCVYQLEVGEQGTEHFQGYCEFENPVRLATLQDCIPGAHWEVRRGTAQQAREYCMKEDTRVEGPFEWGTPSAQGARSDLEEVARRLQDGESVRDVAIAFPSQYIRYSNGFARFQQLIQPRRSSKTYCWVFYGSGGSGKSSLARRLAEYIGGGPDMVYKLPMRKSAPQPYWDGYRQGQVVIIDEFKGNRFEPTFFNELIDDGPLSVPIHGGQTEFNSELVIITTNVTPRLWWPTVEFKHSLQRRLLCFPLFRRLDGPNWKALPPRPSGVSPVLNYDAEAHRFVGQIN